MSRSIKTPANRRDAILNATVSVFGRHGFRKTSIDDIAEAAGISKQGLYLHFSGKDEIFLAAMHKYLADGLILVDAALTAPGRPLYSRLMAAMDAWFGRHLATFTPKSFDVIEAGDRLSAEEIDRYKAAFQLRVATALAEAPEFQKTGNICTPAEVAAVLFHYGLIWKEGRPSRAEFIDKASLCVRACCQLNAR